MKASRVPSDHREPELQMVCDVPLSVDHNRKVSKIVLFLEEGSLEAVSCWEIHFSSTRMIISTLSVWPTLETEKMTFQMK